MGLSALNTESRADIDFISKLNADKPYEGLDADPTVKEVEQALKNVRDSENGEPAIVLSFTNCSAECRKRKLYQKSSKSQLSVPYIRVGMIVLMAIPIGVYLYLSL